VQTHIDLAFADGTYRFALGLAQINELQIKCNAGIGAIFARVLQGRVTEDVSTGHPAYAAYYLTDLTETVRQGLIGGGSGIVDGQEVKVSSLRANALIDNYLLALPLMEQWDLAAAILHAKIIGYTGDADDAPEKKSPMTEDGSTTPAP
jgi:hypothetical protein